MRTMIRTPRVPRAVGHDLGRGPSRMDELLAATPARTAALCAGPPTTSGTSRSRPGGQPAASSTERTRTDVDCRLLPRNQCATMLV
jgi:hypothetical protein